MSQDPFRGGDNILVMADAYEPPRDIDGKHIDMKAIPTNTRAPCAEVMKKCEAEEPWFGIEQVCTSPTLHFVAGEQTVWHVQEFHSGARTCCVPACATSASRAWPASFIILSLRYAVPAMYRNTRCSTPPPSGLWVGQSADSPALRARTTAQPGPAPPSPATSWRPTSRRATLRE